MVPVSIGHVGFVGAFIERNLRHLVEGPHVVAAGVRIRETELFHELALARELQDVPVVGAVAANPEVALAVGRDAVVRFGPLEPLTGTTPSLDQIALRVELENRRCRDTAL